MALAGLILGAYWIFDSLVAGPAPEPGPSNSESVEGSSTDPGKGAPNPTPWGGTASILVGRVQGPRGAVAKAEIQVEVVLGDRIEDLGRARSDASGHWKLPASAIDALEDHEAAGATLQVVATAPGFRPAHRAHPVPLRRPERVSITIDLRPGEALIGTVLDPGGAPVSGAWVQAFEVDADASEAEARERPLDRTHPIVPRRTDAHGRFALPQASPDSIVGLRVSDPVRGHAWWSRFESEGSGDSARSPSITLELGRALEGRVRYGDGSPARGVRVTARPSNVRRGESPVTPFGPGRRHAFAWTDDAGQFRILGLRPGEYLLGTWRDPRNVDSGDPGPGAQRTSFPASAPVEWTLTTPGIRVVVVDPGGRPIPGIPVSLAPLRTSPRGFELPGERQSTWSRGPRAEAHFHVDPGTSQLLSIERPSLPPVEVRLEVPSESTEVEHRAILDLAPPPGVLALRVADIDGAVMGDVRVALLSNITGQGLAGFDSLETDARGFLRGLPIGSWTVRIEPGLDARGRSHYLPLTIESVAITKEPEELLEVDAPLAGRLRIELPVVREERRVDPRGLPRVELLSSYGLTLELRRPDQEPSTPPLRSLGGVLPGETWEHDTWLETGDFVLRVVSPEGWSVEAPLRVDPVVTRALRVEL